MPIYNDIQTVLIDMDKLEIPVIIPTFNTPSYLKEMIQQLEDFDIQNIIICDNNSTYKPMLELLEKLSEKYAVVKWKDNLGPRVYTEEKAICSLMPEYFIITDPDLLLNPDMPKKFINKMKRIVDMYGVSKAGLAIEIFDEKERERFFDADQVDRWESNYWTRKIDHMPEVDDLYAAPIDTTFCLYNRDKFLAEIDTVPGKMTCNTSAIRIAGRFTCKHMGWWAKLPLTEDEYNFYIETITTWSSTENEKKKLGYR